MFKLFSYIKNLPIISINTESTVAKFIDCIVNPKTGNIEAFLVKINDFFVIQKKIIVFFRYFRN